MQASSRSKGHSYLWLLSVFVLPVVGAVLFLFAAFFDISASASAALLRLYPGERIPASTVSTASTASTASTSAYSVPDPAPERAGAHSPDVAWNIGDVFVGVGDPDPTISYRVFDPQTSTFKDTINDQQGSGEHTGCAFDAQYNLYTTSFTHDAVVKFDGVTHSYVTAIDTTIDIGHASPESIVFDANRNFYVGKAGDTSSTTGAILKFDSAGNRLQTYFVAKDNRGADWIDLAGDQHTIFYTSEGPKVLQYDVNSGQKPLFTTLTTENWALRVLPYGDANSYLLVATDNDIELLNSSGSVVRSYTAPGDSGWFALNLDPNGTSFWSATQTSSHHFYRWNIATGNIEIGPIDAGAAIGGLCVKGEITAGQPTPTATPSNTPQPGQPTATPTTPQATAQPTNSPVATPTQPCAPEQITIGLNDPGRPVSIKVDPLARQALAYQPAGNSSGHGASGSVATALPNPPISLQLDDGTRDSSLGLGSGSTEWAALWLNRFTPPAGTYPITLQGIQVLWPTNSGGSVVGKQARLLVYADTDGDGNPSNATLLYQQLITIGSLETFENYPVSVTIPGPGDIYIGFEDYWAQSGYTPRLYPASEDTTASQARSWVVANTNGAAPNISNLGSDSIVSTVDALGHPGNFMVRASGSYGQGGCAPTPTPQPSCAIQFNDVPPGSTFYSYAECLVCQGIVSGYPCGGPGEPCPGSYFRPGNDVTRGQAAKMISNSANYHDQIPSNRQTFEDVQPGSTFWLWIERVALHGAISGYPCGGPGLPCDPQNRPYFRPSNNMTRGQLAKIDANVANYQDQLPPDQQSFTDVPASNPFWLYVERVYLHGVINGYPCGGPGEPCDPQNRPYFLWGNNVTRGQSAKIISITFFPDCSPSSPK